MSANPLVKLHQLGQSIWLDFIRRDMLDDGGRLQQLIERDALMGVTSNPAIFEKAINGSDAYDETIRAQTEAGKSVEEIYETLAVEDVGRAADLFSEVWKTTDGLDGYVSIEVSPHLAHDSMRTIEEARRLWQRLSRPNVMIKVPGTRAGLQAIRHLIGEGINVNVTLLFGLERYRQVIDAYFAGLQDRLSAEQPIGHIASVASFFLSRIDTMVDSQLESVAQGGQQRGPQSSKMQGQVAIASARQAYQIYKQAYASDRWKKLAVHGARPQRLLWASTSTKNPDYSDVMYVEALIGPNTVNTLPPETLEAYRDHGQPAVRLENDLPASADVLKQLPDLGIDLDDVTRQLEDQGVKKFIDPFDKLLKALADKRSVIA